MAMWTSVMGHLVGSHSQFCGKGG
ncbi:mCG9404 [Mus musculus]|nr:mCG9404 [Mus musculus]